jgi:2-polyprenyl-6-methoxyphenol hydroxylase-like FAD-dependent oxidoreductase
MTRVLISGASIAGPTLAYWLLKAGHDVTLVEQAPAGRRSTFAGQPWRSSPQWALASAWPPYGRI